MIPRFGRAVCDYFTFGTVPSVTISPTGIGFVTQGGVIPVRQLDTTPALTLTPNKLAVIFTLTRDIVNGSNAEALVKAVASENISAALDAALFGTQAAMLDQPSGSLRNAPTLTATANAAGVDSLRADLGKLADFFVEVHGAIPYQFTPTIYAEKLEQLRAKNQRSTRLPSGAASASSGHATAVPRPRSARPRASVRRNAGAKLHGRPCGCHVESR
jgi:Phage capsid family